VLAAASDLQVELTSTQGREHRFSITWAP